MPKITWPELTFGPVNLYSVLPAWYFYLSEEEKNEMAQKVAHAGIVTTQQQQPQKRVVH